MSNALPTEASPSTADFDLVIFERSLRGGWHRVVLEADPRSRAGVGLALEVSGTSGHVKLARLRLPANRRRQSIVLRIPQGDWRLQCIAEASGCRPLSISVLPVTTSRAFMERSCRVLMQLARSGPPRSAALRGLAAAWRGRGVRGLLDAVLAPPDSPYFTAAYRSALVPFDQPSPDDLARLKHRGAAFSRRPLISVLMPIYNPELHLLEEAIASVEQQTYPNWELCIADDASIDPSVRPWLGARMQRNSRIRVVFRDRNGGISAASNSALALCRSEFVALLDQDDLLPLYALHCVVACLNAHPDAKLIYSDEDKLDASGGRYDAYHKPDWDPALILGQNLFSHLGVFERRLMLAVGGFRIGFEGSQDYDLLLRCISAAGHGAVQHVPHVLYHWRALPGSTARAMSAKSYAEDAALRALREYLVTCAMPGTIERSRFPGGYRYLSSLGPRVPSVAILLAGPSPNPPDWRDESSLSDYPGVLQVLSPLAGSTLTPPDGNSVSRCIDWTAGLSLPARLNRLAEAASAEVLVFIEPSLRPLSHNWLAPLVALLSSNEVAAVGCRIVDRRRRVLHAGYVIDPLGNPGSPHYGFRVDSPGYFGQLGLLRSITAVSAAAMAVRRNDFLDLGGFDASAFPEHGFDVDFCQRAAASGKRSLITPDADWRDPISDGRRMADLAWYWPGRSQRVAAAGGKGQSGSQPDTYLSPYLTLSDGALLPDPRPRIAPPWILGDESKA